MVIDIAVVTPGQFAAATDRSSSVERVVGETTIRLAQDRYRITVYSRRTGDTPSEEQIGSVIHRRIRAPSRLSYIRQVTRLISRSKPDIIQIENRPSMMKLFRYRFPRTALILSLHSTTFVQPRVYGRRALQSSFRYADHIVVNSEFLAGWLRDRFRISGNKLHVCHPGVDTERFVSRYTRQGREQAEQLRDELGYRDKKVILFMGRLIPIKGVHHILDALPAVVSEHEDVVLVVCGSARYGSDRLTPYVRRLHRQGNKLPRHVRFIPYVAHSTVPVWYQAADVVVLPSAREEAFGLVNVEALACGAPVVSTRSGGIVEIIEHGVNGWLLEPSDLRRQLAPALNSLLHDRQKREQLGRQGAIHVNQRFRWEHTAHQFAEVYEACLIDRQQGRRRMS